ncbi:MAG: polysaccharide biosynthesis/export family protein [Sphingobium sp.]
MRFLRTSFLLLLALTSALFSLSTEYARAQTNSAVPLYLIGPGDIIKITVYGEAVYDTSVVVDKDGSVPVYELGSVVISGLSAAQVGDKLAHEFRSKGILISPVVNVAVLEFRSKPVFIFGNVGKPGEYYLDREGLKLTDMLARSGAILGVGGGTVRIINRAGAQTDLLAAKVLSGELDRLVTPGDTVIVTEAATFYISGEVQRGGSYPIEPGLTMGRAIALAGGLTARGARNKLKVTRKDETGEDDTIKVRAGDMVHPHDDIVVGARIF